MLPVGGGPRNTSDAFAGPPIVASNLHMSLSGELELRLVALRVGRGPRPGGGWIQRLSSPEKMPGCSSREAPSLPFKSPSKTRLWMFLTFPPHHRHSHCKCAAVCHIQPLDDLAGRYLSTKSRFNDHGRFRGNMVPLRSLVALLAGHRRTSRR